MFLTTSLSSFCAAYLTAAYTTFDGANWSQTLTTSDVGLMQADLISDTEGTSFAFDTALLFVYLLFFCAAGDTLAFSLWKPFIL